MMVAFKPSETLYRINADVMENTARYVSLFTQYFIWKLFLHTTLKYVTIWDKTFFQPVCYRPNILQWSLK